MRPPNAAAEGGRFRTARLEVAPKSFPFVYRMSLPGNAAPDRVAAFLQKAYWK